MLLTIGIEPSAIETGAEEARDLLSRLLALVPRRVRLIIHEDDIDGVLRAMHDADPLAAELAATLTLAGKGIEVWTETDLPPVDAVLVDGEPARPWPSSPEGGAPVRSAAGAAGAVRWLELLQRLADEQRKRIERGSGDDAWGRLEQVLDAGPRLASGVIRLSDRYALSKHGLDGLKSLLPALSTYASRRGRTLALVIDTAGEDKSFRNQSGDLKKALTTPRAHLDGLTVHIRYFPAHCFSFQHDRYLEIEHWVLSLGTGAEVFKSRGPDRPSDFSLDAPLDPRPSVGDALLGLRRLVAEHMLDPDHEYGGAPENGCDDAKCPGKEQCWGELQQELEQLQGKTPSVSP